MGDAGARKRICETYGGHFTDLEAAAREFPPMGCLEKSIELSVAKHLHNLTEFRFARLESGTEKIFVEKVAPTLVRDGFMPRKQAADIFQQCCRRAVGVDRRIGERVLREVINANVVGVRIPSAECMALDLPQEARAIGCIVPFVPLDRVCLRRVISAKHAAAVKASPKVAPKKAPAAKDDKASTKLGSDSD